MPKKRIRLPYHVDFVSILDQDGKVDPDLEPSIPADDLRRLYRTMLLAREFDQRMIRLQRQGRLGTLAPSLGQEAASLGAVYALGEQDWVVPYIRELAGFLWRGWKLEQFLLYYAGYEEAFSLGENTRDLPFCIPVATQLLHAVGLAWALKRKGEKGVVLCFFGDGATSEGDFHEALNFASVYQVPVIFLCQNNQYAISVPVKRQTHSTTLAQKALAYDMPGVQVDGNDLLAVYRLTEEAVRRARQGGGPTLIEALTYRLSVHTTADDPSRYRKEEEVREWEGKDPLKRFRLYLEAKKLWDEEREEECLGQIREEIQQAVERAESMAKGDPLEMFDYTYAELSPDLRRQREELEKLLKSSRPQELIGAGH